jgi:predicted nucleic acid-binding protein
VIVVDASAALSALFNDGPARFALTSEQLHVPHLIDAEVASGVRRKVLAGEVSTEDGWTVLDTWRRLGVLRYPSHTVVERVWELRANVSAYDATYVALAEHLDVTLLTADRRLGGVPAVRCPVTLVPR